MGTPSPSHRPLHGRVLVGLLTLVFAITAGGWITTGLAAQGQKKEEEEDTTKVKKKPPKVEEEEDRPAPKRKVIKVDDDEPKPSKAPSKPGPRLQAPPAPEAQMSIVEALREAKNPELKEFYTNLKVPHDNITVRSLEQTRTYAIEPQPTYYDGPQTSFRNRYLQALTFDKEWRPSGSPQKFESALRIQPYEEIVLDDVESFLKKDFDRGNPNSPRYLSRADMLKAAETVLAAADRFHASAVEKQDRRGEEWKDVGRRLHERLFDIQKQRLDAFAAAGDWDGASAYARTLADAYRDPKERAAVADRLVKMIQNTINTGTEDDRWREARQRLRFLEEVLPGTEALRTVTTGLRQQAQTLLDQAKALRTAEKFQEATARMELAAAIDPGLPGLAQEMASLDRDHPVLRVGVRDLPINLVPGLATTDADRRAVELMYEGLVKLHAEPGAGQRYEPCLAGGAPRLIPLGREFRIARGATWSDGTPVTVGDVNATLQAMRKPDWPGYSRLWNAMIEEVEGGGDSFRLSLRLHQGYLDPLSLMTFKVMSQSALRGPLGPNTPKISSGPFQYKGMFDTTPRNRKTAVFLASPGYASREGKLGLPRVREIHLIHFADPADDPATALERQEIDMVLDLSAATARDLRDKSPARDALEVRGPMATRRVYFLAVNHRAGPLKGNKELRKALALAIDRQTILNNCFRAEPGKLHHSLNGPFPAGSWPCEPKVPAELYDREGAKAQARAALEKAEGPITLTLLYPSGDPAVEAAMKQLCESVNKELRLDNRKFIELKPEGLQPANLRERVEEKHSYQLAYYHYDYPSESYWLAPLFDSQAMDINGSNYMGCVDPALLALFATAKNHRDFDDVRKAMHAVHRQLHQEMPLIPLWQLDTFLAYRKGVKPTAVDPIVIFNDVEHWSLNKR
jgi:peptide/nickel transport system substrate-binding protein